jgi:F420H(2)-dependent biliverdin reductase
MTGSFSPGFQEFWRERHLCTLTTLRPDGTPHVTPVGAVLDAEAGCSWVITSRHSQKAHHVAAATGTEGAPVAVCQVDGRRWATLEGTAVVLDDDASVREAELRYAQRYRTPRENPDRVAIRIDVRRTLGNA